VLGPTISFGLTEEVITLQKGIEDNSKLLSKLALEMASEKDFSKKRLIQKKIRAVEDQSRIYRKAIKNQDAEMFLEIKS